jgi:hypothetical protein
MVHPQDQATASSLHTKVAPALTLTDMSLSFLVQLGDDHSVILTGAKHKKRILQEYERDFRNNLPIPQFNSHTQKVSILLIGLVYLLFA